MKGDLTFRYLELLSPHDAGGSYMDREKEGFSWDKRKTYLYGWYRYA
jgi:hypothetical protein